MEQEQRGKITYEPRPNLVYEAEPCDLALNRYKLELLLRDAQETKSISPKWEPIACWIGIGLALLLPILATDFRTDFLGLSAETWQGAVFAGMVLSFVLSIYYGVKLLWFRIKHRNDPPPLTPKETVQQLVTELQSSSTPDRKDYQTE